VNEVNLSPSSEDDIDPGVNVSVTGNVTDVSNVSAVVLQYKAPLAGTYTNDSMDYNQATSLWENGTIITTISDIGNWSYRIWTNDTFGNSGPSQIFNMNVDWDKSWTLSVINSSGNFSEDLGVTSGFKGSVKTLGILIVNNTGDFSMNFDLESSPPTVSITYNVTEPFDLPAGNEKQIEVNATMPDTSNEYPVTINVTSTGSSPPYVQVNATVLSYIGGPYINETTEITDYPLSITQGGSANFTAYVRNIGNETAFDVWLNWTFPSGWSITYGNMTNMIGNLSPQASATITITASAGSAAKAGAAIIWVNSSSNGTAGGDFKSVSVNCNNNDNVCGVGCNYVTDDDCEPPDRDSVSTFIAGVLERIDPRIGISMPERINLVKGGSYNLTIDVSNPVENTNLTQITIGLDGYPETLLTARPSMISYIDYNMTKSFLLEIGVPSYIEEKDFLVSVTVKGIGEYGGDTKYVESSEKILFMVHGVMENESLTWIKDAELAVEGLKNLNFSFEAVENILEDAKRAYSNLDFDAVKRFAQKVMDLQEKALRVSSLIGKLEMDIEAALKYGLTAEEATRMKDMAKSAFQRGDYKRAEERITAAITAYQLETKNIIPLMMFLYERWYVLLIFVFSMALVSFFTRKRLKIRSLERGLESLRDRKKSVKELIRNVQDDYFKKGSISKLDYNLRKGNYEKRLASLGSEEIKIATETALTKGGRKRESLLKEKGSIERRLKGIQHGYFELGKMGQGEYNESVKRLQAELAEVESGIRKLERRGRSKGMLGFFVFFAVLATFSVVPASAVLENVTADDAMAAITDAEAVIDDMRSLGFGTESANHTLNQARLMLLREEYDLAVTTARYVSVIKQKAVIVNEMIDVVESRMYEFSSKGYDVSESQKSFLEGVEEYEKMSYEEAETLLSRAMDRLDSIEREAVLSRASQENLLDILGGKIYEYRLTVSVFVVLSVLLSVPVFVKIRRVRKARGIKRLKNEIKNTKDSMKALQNSYFVKGHLSKKNYGIRMEEYKKELDKTMESLEAAKKHAGK